MTHKERFLTAMQNQVPDRVPCTPDISNYIPCKKTEKPYWDIYFHDDPPLWKAYIDAADHYEMEMWIASCMGIPLVYEDRKVDIVRSLRYIPEKDATLEEIIYTTPDGELREERLCFRQDPPTPLTRIIKDLEQDWKAYKWLLTPPSGIDQKLLNTVKEECYIRNQAFGCVIGYPGFQSWEGMITGGIQTLSYASIDYPEILDEWCKAQMEAGTRSMELYLEQDPDYVLFGGSGTITLASPDLVRKYAIPALKKWSAMAKKAGVPSLLHCCGKSRVLVDMLVEHTDINCVNPLEIPPMGDVNLAEVKKTRGSQIALMGNLHTTELMLFGTPEQVYQASVEAIQDGAQGGGFILSTGDQCPRETPDENIFAMIQATKDSGQY